MRSGGGKSKGSGYERRICKLFSLWLTDGEKEDCLWRSSLSGGRATVAHRKGVTVRQAGDITAVAPEGHAFCSKYFVECKHVKNLNLEAFFLTDKGLLAKFWKTVLREARKHHLEPMIIARQNFVEDLIIMRPPAFKVLIGNKAPGMSLRVKRSSGAVEIRLLADVLKQPFKG